MSISLEFLVLEHRPEHLDNVRPKSRTLKAIKLFRDGIKIYEQPRFEKFDLTVLMPHNGQSEKVSVKVVSKKIIFQR